MFLKFGAFFSLFLSLPLAIHAAGDPTFSGTTPSNYATSSVGTPITVSVSSTVAIGSEHSLTLDWNRKLIGWWRFDSSGDMTDYSGTGNTLTNNGATWSASGKYGGSYAFDVVTDYLSITSSTYDLSSSDPYTISLWVKPNNTGNKTALQLGTDGGSGSYMGFLNAGAGQTVEYAMRQNYSGNWLGVTSVATVSSSTWNHIVVTNDRTNLKIYINGALSNTQALGAFGSYTAVFNVFIGKNLWGDYFNGSIDDTQFYKRALVAGEISSLYNAQSVEYSNSFTPSSSGTYLYTAYAQSTSGVVSSTGQRTLYVGVTPPSYTLTYSAGTHGSISGSSTQSVAVGQNGTTVTAVADDHFQFSSWSDALSSNPRTDTGITGNVSVTANFVSSTYTLSYSAGSGGSLSGSISQSIAYGMNGTAVIAVPDSGYSFSGWSDGSLSDTRTDASVSASASYTANFTRISTGGGAATAFVPSSPVIIAPPTITNGVFHFDVSNVFQMAISESENFAGGSWEPYRESYRELDHAVYIKFRSPDGGESSVFRIDPIVKSSEESAPRVVLSSKSSTSSVAVVKHVFTRNLRRGMNGEDVRELQKYLNGIGFLVASKGVGSLGSETMYFGSATAKALAQFQKAHKLPATGYFGSMTRVLIDRLK